MLNRDDDDLLCAIGRGDRSAFETLMRRHGQGMLALAQRITRSASDADEVVQESFLKVWAMAPNWNRDGTARFSTWLYRVVSNGSIDRRRRPLLSAMTEAETVVADDPDGLADSLRRQREAFIREAMRDLPVRQREALLLRYFSEISTPRAARDLQISTQAFEALLVRGKRALREALRRRGIQHIKDLL